MSIRVRKKSRIEQITSDIHEIYHPVEWKKHNKKRKPIVVRLHSYKPVGTTQTWLKRNNFKVREIEDNGTYITLTTIGPDDRFVLHSVDDRPAFVIATIPYDRWKLLLTKVGAEHILLPTAREAKGDGKDSLLSQSSFKPWVPSKKNPFILLEWATNDVVDRIGGPARIYPRDSDTGNTEFRVWMRDGFISRGGGRPPLESVFMDYSGEQYDQYGWQKPLRTPLKAGKEFIKSWGVYDASVGAEAICGFHNPNGPALYSIARNPQIALAQPARWDGKDYDLYGGPFPIENYYLHSIQLTKKEHKDAIHKKLSCKALTSMYGDRE